MSTANIIGNAIFGLRNKSGGNYINPAVKESLVGLWKFDQNTNESPTRNIIKNTIKDKGGDLELLNFGYKLNSGYGKYIEDFSLFTLSNRFEYSEISNTKVTITAVLDNDTGIYHAVKEEESALYWNTFKIKVSGSTDDVYISYVALKKSIRLYNGINTVVVPNELSWHTFTASTTNVSCNITLEFVPEYEGALVTDGKDDMIVSQKTVQEMLGGSNKITVVSMIHQINACNSAANTSYTNYIRGNIGFVRNTVTNADKTGIYGYTWNNSTKSTINNILGDKNDYRIETGNSVSLEEKFSVEGYINNGSPTECSEVAIYWTFISNKVLTTDEINQIIGYYKLDKYVTPQVIYDVKRQGLTNDTPAADWYLKDFSGNGHDMQLYNYAKKGNSGVGKYEEDFTSWSKTSSLNLTSSGFTIKSVNDFNNTNWILWSYLNTSPKSFKIRVNGSPNNSLLIYRYQKDGSTIAENIVLNKDGVYELPASIYVQNGNGFRIDTMDKSDLEKYIGLSVEQIPDYEGALVSDGKDDYGHADNLPIFKDYTVAIDRAWTNDLVKAQCLTSKLNGDNLGSFSFELIENGFNSYSFGISNKGVITIDSNKKISYQSKYVYNGSPIISGNNVDGKDLFLFRNRDSYPYYAEAAIWSYILFPYTLSEFLLERQLKRYKLGTLYPDMVEFRPIVKSSSEYQVVDFYIDNLPAVVGKYYPINSALRIAITTQGQVDEISSIKVNGVDFGVPSINGNKLTFNGTLSDKSPQKIDITIYEYIRFEDIVQPYPVIVNIPKVDGGYYTYGNKIPVGYRFRRESAINLLPELYSLSDIFLNGELCNVGAEIVISKSMVFTANKTWLLDTPEPHAIYSPQKLNISNSSLKILGYVPDLTGKGNHGKLNNFAYTEDSGVAADGSIKFDGKDDHIIIPTLAHGGKCVMMKVNWSNVGLLYDQRPSGGHNTFGIYTGENPPAYSARNNGSTYIDGILNTNIIPSNLAGITHNITAVNDTATDNSTTSPRLGTSFTNATFSNMSLYEFMLFPDVPNEEEIKELNDVMGIEGGYVESPNYYWDAYGKANRASADIDYKDLSSASDTHKQLIDKSIEGLAAIELYHSTGNFSGIRDRRLYLNNVAYNSESGYGYGKSNFISIMESSQQFVDIIDDYNFIIKATPHNNNQFFAQVNTPKLIPNNYIRFKVSGIPEDFKMVFGYDYVEGGTNEYSHIIDKNGVYSYDSFNIFYISFRAYTGYTDLTGLNIKVEFLDYHPNGLLLDGVEDHAVNTVIPAVTDFTVIAKREWINKDTIGNECFIHKGVINTPIGETAFMLEYEIAKDTYYRSSSYGGYINIERTNRPEKIIYQTPTSYNGTAITKGSGTDTIGLTLGAVTNNYWHGVFYKLMFYTKTIDQLSINMLKNLFERDELIDVTNPIFKKQ